MVENSKTGGAIDKAKGKIKEVGGSITDNPEKRIEGRDQQTLGEREMDRAEMNERDRKRTL